MTLVLKHYKSDKYYISLEFTNNCYVVQACPVIGDNLAGYPVREMRYSYMESEKAHNTFKRYIRKYI